MQICKTKESKLRKTKTTTRQYCRPTDVCMSGSYLALQPLDRPGFKIRPGTSAYFSKVRTGHSLGHDIFRKKVK